MQKIKFTVGLNDDGDPCIDIPNNYVGNPEDKLAVFEITRYILQNIIPSIDNEDIKNEIIRCEDSLSYLSTYVGKLLKGIMISNGEMEKMTNKNFNIPVKTFEDLNHLISNSIKDNYLIHDVKMYDVTKGIVFKITDTGETYSYFDGELILND